MKAMKHHKIALRHFTEKDFVRPRKIAQNGYRLFDGKKIYTLKETNEKNTFALGVFFMHSLIKQRITSPVDKTAHDDDG
ncbi:hypothetical protein [Bacillus safensis]|uniref:hypothetical protein n=1 Tax=Bacillus safensis TaxID=561879 RepID=UPI00227D9C7C|nr:hypothetical protein [Bacillus safensis]MCY7494214.1 hypothetical protein [Bacillus safensis]MED4991940.1 hypothetical protein [Bacillus safensis]